MEIAFKPPATRNPYPATHNQEHLDKTPDIPYFTTNSALLHTPPHINFQLQAISYELYAMSYQLIWGRNGFDGDKEAPAAYRAFLSARKTDGNLNIIADDYEYALAA
jgi:hypothetical protein